MYIFQCCVTTHNSGSADTFVRYDDVTICASVLCHDSGLTEVDAFVLYDGETMEYSITPDADGSSFDVAFRGAELGRYTVAVYAGGMELQGKRSLSRLHVSVAHR